MPTDVWAQLLEEREALLRRLEVIDGALAKLSEALPDAAPAATVGRRPKRHTGEMSLWRLTAAFVEERGKKGATRNEIQAHLRAVRKEDIPPQSITSAIHKAKSAGLIVESGEKWFVNS